MLKLKPMVLKIREVAEVLNCHPSTVYQAIYNGDLRVVSRSGRLLVPVAELDRYLNDVQPYAPKPRRPHAR